MLNDTDFVLPTLNTGDTVPLSSANQILYLTVTFLLSANPIFSPYFIMMIT